MLRELLGMTEADLQKQIQNHFKKDPNILITKFHGGPNQPITCDLIGCNRGVYFELEVKLPGKEKTLTERQKLRLRRVQEAGGRCGVVTSVEQATNIVYDY